MLWRNHGQKCFSEQQLVRLVDQRPILRTLLRCPSIVSFFTLLNHLSPFSPLHYSSPCGRNCSVRPPGLSGSQRSTIPGLSRRQPLVRQTSKSLLVRQRFLILGNINVVTDCGSFEDGQKVQVEGKFISNPTPNAPPTYTVLQPGRLLSRLVRKQARQFHGMSPLQCYKE